MLLARVSRLTGKLHTMELPITQQELDRYYKTGELVQTVFPHLTTEQREFIMTGITPEEWAILFKESGFDDEDDE